MKITATRAVWLHKYHMPAELLGYIEKGNFGRAIDILWCYGPPEQEKFADYTRVGEAEITLTLLPRDKQAALAVASLQKKLEELRAAYLTKQQEILAQISKLQCLEAA